MSERPHVVVVGSVMTDMTVSIDRVPAAGETLVGNSFLLGFGGKGANQAAMAALLGARVSMVACVGADAFGREAIENLDALGIDTQGIEVLDGSVTGVAPIWVEANGENRIVIVPGANSLMTPERVEAAMVAAGAADVVICQLEVPLSCVRRALERGRAQGATTILNPAPFVTEACALFELADWIVPNEVEFEALCEVLLGSDAVVDTTLEQRLRRTVERLGVSVLVTHGERGAFLQRAGEQEVQRIAAPLADVLDTSGAGDAVVGAFASALAGGEPHLRAAETAISCASMTVEARGTQASFAQAARRLSPRPSKNQAGDETAEATAPDAGAVA